MDKMPSIDLVYDMINDQHKLISDWCDSLDNKVVGLFGVTTLFIGIITTVNKGNLALNWQLIPFVVAVIAFAVSCLFSFRSFQTRRFYIGLDPRILLADYASRQPEDAKYYLVNYDGQYWEQNLEAVNKKACSLRVAIFAGAVEIIALIVWVVLV